jgi:hypothetical protein
MSSFRTPSEQSILEAAVVDIVRRANEHLALAEEKFLIAFIAETGLKPSECELVQETRDREIVFYFRRRKPEVKSGSGN